MSWLSNDAPRSARSLAWSAAVASLAIEKIRQGAGVVEEEKVAIAETAKGLSSLSKASQIGGDSLVHGKSERLTSALRESLSTLVALETSSTFSVDPILFEEVGQKLSRVAELLEKGEPLSVPDSDLEQAQSLCFNLLDQLAGRSGSEQIGAEA